MVLLSSMGEWLRLNWMTVLLILFLLAMWSYGWRRGLVRMSFSFISFLLSAVLSRILFPYLSAYLGENRALTEWFRNRIFLYLQRESGAMQEKRNAAMDAVYRLLGIERLADYAAEQLANFLLSLILFLLILFLSRIALRLFFTLLDRVMRLPLFNELNRGTGAVLGLAEGFFYIWVLLIVLGLLPEYEFSRFLAEQFALPGSFPAYLRDHNLIVYFFTAMLTG